MTDFSKTINLPSTAFAMKANLSETENLRIDFWKEKKIFQTLKKNCLNEKKYILHDGPPYANGDLHLGHALNKILKDIVCRLKFQDNFDVDFIPGWDCHGLPIEWKVEEKFKKKGVNKDEIDVIQFRKECRDFADHWVDEQRKQFCRFGIQTDWEKIYLTMTKDSEITIVKELLKFLEKGDLFLGFKPVMWSVVEQTALAEAEIEYHDKVSSSIFVKFPVKSEDNLSIIIWTTTPWTIPCNKGLAYSEELKYKIINIEQDHPKLNLIKNEKLIIAEDLLSDFIKSNEINSFRDLEYISNKKIGEFTCKHPLESLGFNYDVKVFPSDHVTAENGTGFVHIAPNHGQEDFDLGQIHNLGNDPTVNEKGVYEKNINFFEGMHIFKSDEKVIEQLDKFGKLVSNSNYSHSYPHSWRSKAPLIFRATSQWFISMDKNNLRKKAIDQIDNVDWIPENSKKRILSMVKDRPDWCVSRQRNWGVPITVFLSKETQKPLIDNNVNKKIIEILKKEGVDSWFTLPNENFLPEKYNANDFEKVFSILDVWFDSGSSHVYVLKNNGIKQADLYLEGSDQHRGWFQTSLLESCAIYGESPYKSVLTHGFVIDENGKKMSKSLGNVISPKDVISKYGADILRIWVASSNFNEDIKISFENIKRQSESYRKIRNTLRFLIGNLNYLNVEENIKYEILPEIEKLILHRIFHLNSQINTFYDSFNFSKVFQIVLNFCGSELSSFFFDIRKDSLYCDSVKSEKVKSTKFVMKVVFEYLIRWLSPIIPFTTEEAWQCWKNEVDKDAQESCHLLKRLKCPDHWNNKKIGEDWDKIFEIRNLFLNIVEEKRNEKEIKSSMEAKVHLFLDDKTYESALKTIDLSEVLISSEVNYAKNFDDSFISSNDNSKIKMKVEINKGVKCPRCWKIFTQKFSELCNRCQSVVNEKN
ncbi:MAG: isoleucine--tRNA ligase [Alphaproteobacteria bacterium]|nr:isoleucine--tRNA ligase [Alphaproteobacteria bacterium]